MSGGVLTVDDAICNGIRLLEAAELETNLSTMERLNALADSWLYLAVTLAERENA